MLLNFVCEHGMFCALAYSRKSLFTAAEKSQETEILKQSGR